MRTRYVRGDHSAPVESIYRCGVRSPEFTLVVILLLVAGAGIALSVVTFGANMLTVFTSIGAGFVAAIGAVTAPALAPRSVPAGVIGTVVAVALEGVAALLLLSFPASNSSLWVPINIGRFGGVIVAELALALSLHATVLRRLASRRAMALVSLNVLAIAIGVAIAGWENRS